jgi:hypothetical protein
MSLFILLFLVVGEITSTIAICPCRVENEHPAPLQHQHHITSTASFHCQPTTHITYSHLKHHIHQEDTTKEHKRRRQTDAEGGRRAGAREASYSSKVRRHVALLPTRHGGEEVGQLLEG